MPRFAANLSLMFLEHPFLKRFAAAKAAGFEAVEFQFPYEFEAKDIAFELDRNTLELTLFNLPPGDFANGERGIACLDGRDEEFQHGIEMALYYAQYLKAKKINCLAGIKPNQLPHEVAFQNVVRNIRWAYTALNKSGITLLLESINTFDMPNFLLNTSDDFLKVLDATHCDIKFQFDVYHLHRSGENVIAKLYEMKKHIGHIQIADHPGRHEPGSGEIDFRAVFSAIDDNGYAGFVGCEYKPKTETRVGLKWMTAY